MECRVELPLANAERSGEMMADPAFADRLHGGFSSRSRDCLATISQSVRDKVRQANRDGPSWTTRQKISTARPQRFESATSYPKWSAFAALL
jgi:hypothetical protein